GDKVHSMGSSGRGGYQTFFDHTPRTVSRVAREKWSHGLIEEGRGVWSTQEMESNVVVSETALAPAYPGDSGGPLVNERGELVGMVCSGSKTHPMFIEGGEIREMMASSGFFAKPSPTASAPAAGAVPAAAPKPAVREGRAKLRFRLPEKGTLVVNGVAI